MRLEYGRVDGRKIQSVAHLQMRRSAQAVERAGDVRAVDLVHGEPAVLLIGKHLLRRKEELNCIAKVLKERGQGVMDSGRSEDMPRCAAD